MRKTKIDYNKVTALSFKDLSYINQADYLNDFYTYSPELDSFEKVIQDRRSFDIDRELLVEQLEKAYSGNAIHDLQKKNIRALKNKNSFTVITAHQPSLLGGPLYYVLKICSVINLSRQLNEKFKDYHITPVFISGGEDHDFEEVNHLNLYGKRIEWNRESKGAVGRLSIEGLQDILNQVKDILGDSPNAVEINGFLNAALEGAKTYGDFVFQFVNMLFGSYGLIVVNMDNPKMKKAFAPKMKKEILERKSESIVQASQDRLAQHGFKAQAFPRDINLFYLGNNDRQRIYFNNGLYNIYGSELNFSESEILRELEDSPQNFSPNVVMRPLYQESILPNLAYIGGGGEIAYWLERKDQFKEYNTFFPMLIRRNSAMIVNKGQHKTWDKLGFDVDGYFRDKDELIRSFLAMNTDIEIDLSTHKAQLSEIYESIAKVSQQVDPTLGKSVLAEKTKTLKNIDQMESRMQRSLKSQQDTNVKKIEKVKEKLFPNNGLQERHDNFMSFYLSEGKSLFDYLIHNLNPLDASFTCILPDE